MTEETPMICVCSSESFSDFQCTKCNSIRCDQCNLMINESEYSAHLDIHEFGEDVPEQVEEVPVAQADIHPSVILCTDIYDGCGLENSYDNDKCTKCNRLLKVTVVNSEERILFLGQSIFFNRNDGIPEPGIIVDIKDDDDSIKVICKYKNIFTDSVYDVTRDPNDIFTTIEELSSKLGTRKRKEIETYRPNTTKQSKKAKKTKNSDIEKPPKVEKPSKTSSVSKIKKVKLPPPPPLQLVSSPSSNNSSPRNTSVDNNDGEHTSKPKRVNSNNGDTSKAIKKSKANTVLSNGVDSFNLEDEFCAHKLDLVAQFCDLNPSNNISREFHGRYLDKYLKKGILHVLWNWAVPDRRQEEIDALGEHAWKPSVSVQELQDIVKHCPVSIDQMKKMNCKRLLDLYPAPQENTSSSSSSSSSSGDHKSIGEEIIDCIKNYLTERSYYDETLEETLTAAPFLTQLINDVELEQNDYRISIEELKKLKLSLPLPYYYFRAVMNHAYGDELFGGSKIALENAPGIRGRKDVKNEQGEVCHAMYGSMTESFTEDTIVQNTRMGKSNIFVDIGSGIGQINIQVAATTLASNVGIELEKERFDCSLNLLNVFDEVLEKIGVEGRITPLVTFICGNFLDKAHVPDITKGDVIFFDNFGPWFAGKMASSFCELIVQKTADNTQIITVNQLMEAHTFCITEDLESGLNACTWLPSEKLKLFRYVRAGNVWTCRNCTFQNELCDSHCIQCATVNRSKRTGNHNKLSRA